MNDSKRNIDSVLIDMTDIDSSKTHSNMFCSKSLIETDIYTSEFVGIKVR